MVIAAASSTVVLGAAALAIGNSPGWPRVRDAFFDADIAWRSLPAIVEGFAVNLTAFGAVVPLALVLGLAVALARTAPGPMWFPVRAAATGYVDVLRGVPVIVTLYVIGFGLPGLRLQGVPDDPVVLGIVAITLTYAAYVAEVIRAGILAVPSDQTEAAALDGASRWQTMRAIVLPQAFRLQQPALLNDLVALQKDCGLISVLGAIDAVRAARIEAAATFTFTPYLVAGVLFIALAVPTGRLADWAASRSVTGPVRSPSARGTLRARGAVRLRPFRTRRARRSDAS